MTKSVAEKPSYVMMHTAVFCCARLRGTGLRAAPAAGGRRQVGTGTAMTRRSVIAHIRKWNKRHD